MTFVDDILGPITEGEKALQDRPDVDSQEWLDLMSKSVWYKHQTGNAHAIKTTTLGAQETSSIDYFYEEDPYWEEEDYTERGTTL